MCLTVWFQQINEKRQHLSVPIKCCIATNNYHRTNCIALKQKEYQNPEPCTLAAYRWHALFDDPDVCLENVDKRSSAGSVYGNDNKYYAIKEFR